MNQYIKDSKIFTEQSKFKKNCEFCGHTLSFYAFEKDRKCCSHCGRFNYKNDFIKLKYKLREKGIKIEKCDQLEILKIYQI